MTFNELQLAPAILQAVREQGASVLREFRVYNSRLPENGRRINIQTLDRYKENDAQRYK